jgi:hypothetical protein
VPHLLGGILSLLVLQQRVIVAEEDGGELPFPALLPQVLDDFLQVPVLFSFSAIK